MLPTKLVKLVKLMKLAMRLYNRIRSLALLCALLAASLIADRAVTAAAINSVSYSQARRNSQCH